MIKKISKDELHKWPNTVIIPPEFIGQWVAWSHDQKKIVAHGRELAEVHAAADAAGHPDAILEMARSPHSFIGAI